MSTLHWVGKNLSLGGLVMNTGRGAGAALRIVGADKAASVVTGATKLTGDAINLGVRKASEAAGGAVAGVAEACGASRETVETARKVGKLVGAAGIGLTLGSLADVALISAFAASGTAGAAATTSGLAALGGGSMATGQVVTEAVAAASTIAGTASTAARE